MRINTNIVSLQAQRQLSSTTKALARALERLSSGERVNRAGDDAAGLAIGERLKSEVNSLGRVAKNINEAGAYLQTAESAMGTQLDIIQRMRELAVQSANGTLGVEDRSHLDNEFQTLLAEFNRITAQTDFNGNKLLDGSMSTLQIQVGTQKNQAIDLRFESTEETEIFTSDSEESIGDGTFSLTNNFAPGGVDMRDAKFADLDGDGDEDVVMVDGTNDRLITYLNDGDGSYSLSQSRTTVTNAFRFQLADIDGDDVLDVVMGSFSGVDVISWYKGTGTGTFGAGVTISASPYANQLEVIDLDNDGDKDIVATETVVSSSQFAVLLNNGNGTFSPSVTYLSGIYTFDIKVGDFTGDEILDVLSTSNNEQVLYLNAGVGNGTFSAATTLTISGNYPANNRDIEIGDFDNDGNLDVIMQRSGSSNQKATIYWGDGAGSFSSATTFNIDGIYELTFNVSDLNSDGIDDIIISDHLNLQYHIRYGGNRSTTLSTATSSGPDMIRDVGDFNGDGVPDLLFANSTTGMMSFYEQGLDQEALEVDLSIETQTKAQNVLAVLSHATDAIVGRRASLGAQMNRLDSALSNTLIMQETLSAAKSQILDADIAEETAEVVRNQILQQAGVSVLSQANMSMQIVLGLLRF